MAVADGRAGTLCAAAGHGLASERVVLTCNIGQ